MHSKKKNLIKTVKNKICLLKILSRAPFYPWDYFYLGKEYLRMHKPSEAARNFMKAEQIMANIGYKSLTEAACEEAKEIYQNLEKENPVLLKRKEYSNFGRIHAFFNPFPKDSIYLCPLYKCKDSFFGR